MAAHEKSPPVLEQADMRLSVLGASASSLKPRLNHAETFRF